jgi:hypothetical protein
MNIPQLLGQFAKPLLHPIRLDIRERLPVHARRAVVETATLVGMRQDVVPVHLVVQLVEPIAGRRFRLRTQHGLKLLNLFWSFRLITNLRLSLLSILL